MQRIGSLRRRLALLLAAIVVSLALAECLLRLWPVPGRRAALQAQFIEADARLGWRHRRDAAGVVDTSEFQHALHYNERGLRGPVRPYQAPPETRRVVLLGDSFLDGYTVTDEARVDRCLEDELADAGAAVEVIAFGVPGYGTDQELLVLQDEALRYQPDLVVLFFHDNDVVFNGRQQFSRGDKPRFRIEGDGLVLELPAGPDRVNSPPPRSAGDRLRAAFRHSRVYRWLTHAFKSDPARHGWLVRNGLARAPGELLTRVHDVEIPAEFLVYLTPAPAEIEASWELTEALLKAMHQTLTERGIPLLLLYVPPRAVFSPELRQARNTVYGLTDEQWDFTQVGSRLAEICTRHGWALVDPTEEFQRQSGAGLYFPGDGHWNADGHHQAALAIQRWIDERRPWR